MTPVTVTAAVAVAVTARHEDVPAAAWPKASGAPLSGALSGAPKPITRPSSVPTYTRPPSVAGTAYLVAAPIGADQSIASRPFTGMARNASILPPGLPGPPVFSSHTTALAGSVPFDVTTGEPEGPKNGSGVCPAAVSAPVAVLNRNARRTSPPPW